MNKKNIGYISIETVITAALILAIGMAALMNFGVLGLDSMTKGMGKLDGTGVFNSGTISTPTTGSYDLNGYDVSLNVKTADINPVSDFEFEDLGSSYRIKDYLNTTDFEIVIPKVHTDGKPITEIKMGALANKLLTSAIIPNSITSIGGAAFSNNPLTSIIIPSSVIYLGSNIFSHNQLVTANIPDGITTIDSGLFVYNKLTSIVIPSSVTTILDVAFYNNKLTSIIFPAGLTSIGSQAFSNNSLTSIIIPNNVTVIAGGAFWNNPATTLTLSNKLTSIGATAFQNNKLTSVVIPETVTEIGYYAFSNNLLTAVEFKGAAPTIIGEAWDATSGVFSLNAGLGANSIKVPAGQLEAYQNLATSFGVSSEAFYE